MQAPAKPASSPPDKKQLPIATFKTSLRAWQARYKARQAAQVIVSKKDQTQTTPA